MKKIIPNNLPPHIIGYPGISAIFSKPNPDLWKKIFYTKDSLEINEEELALEEEEGKDIK